MAKGGKVTEALQKAEAIESAGTAAKEAMLEALEKSMGIVTTASKIVGINRSTHNRWMNSDPEYKEAVRQIEETALDFVENKLYNAINEGDTTAIIFYLKTKGKRRGYVERTELTGADGKDLMPFDWAVFYKKQDQ